MQQPFWKRNTSKKTQREIERLATAAGLDVKAVNILINTFWDADDSGISWVSRPKTPPADLAYAIERGVMAPPRELTHDEIIDWVIASRDQLEPSQVAGAFASSLSTRRFDIRSTLGTYGICLHLEPHQFLPHRRECLVCGLKSKQKVDVNLERFLRIYLGGNIHRERMDFAVCDLTAFLDFGAPDATADDWQVLDAVLQAIRGLPTKSGLGDLQKSLTGLFPSEKYQRQAVLEILGECGVLQPRSQPSFREQFVPRVEREEASGMKAEWQWPVQHWTGSDGVNEEAVAFWFPELAR